MAVRTDHLRRFLLFGSFVSAKETPRDVDVLLIMGGDFTVETAPRECRTLFSHADAEARFGASIFWIRQGMLSDEQMVAFIETWQITRAGHRRGLVEIVP